MTDIMVAHFRGQKRTITLEIGRMYKIKPMNPVKKKNVGRVCTILELNDDFMPTEASVKWEDTGRKGKVKDLSDLVMFEPDPVKP